MHLKGLNELNTKPTHQITTSCFIEFEWGTKIVFRLR